MGGGRERLPWARTRGELMFTCIGGAVLLGAFIWWLTNEGITTAHGFAAAAVSFGLFAFVCVKNGPALWRQCFGPCDEAPSLTDSEPAEYKSPRPELRILLWLLLSRAVLFGAAYALCALQTGDWSGPIDTIERTWRIGYGVDAPSYLGIAERWYVTEGDALNHIVFFPFFPLLVRAASLLTGEYLWAGFLVSNLCSCAAAVFLYRLARLDMPHRDASRAVRYIFLFPGAFFFAMPMTEAAFLLTTVLCVYSARRGRWLLAGAFGFCAAFSRMQGAILMLPLLIEAIRSYREGCAAELRARYTDHSAKHRDRSLGVLLRALAILLTLCGILAYLWVNCDVWGDPFKFTQIQRDHWGQSFNLFFDTAAYETEYLASAIAAEDLSAVFGLYVPNLLVIFGVPAMLIFAGGRMRPSYLWFLLAFYALSLGVTWLLSGPRYMTAAFPMAFAAASLTENRGADAAASLLLAVMQAAYLYMFVGGGPVY